MKYRRSDGTTFVLASHTPEEWAEAYAERLRNLGCSEQYVRKIAKGIRSATTDHKEMEA